VKSDWSAKGKSPAGDFAANAALTSDGGLTGSTVPARAKNSYRVDVATIVPCDATSAQVCVVLTVDKSSTTGTTDSKCATFVEGGKTVVPTGTIGLLGLTLVLGGALVVAQMLSRRRKRVELG
jgi:predicted phage tail protein